MDKLDFIYQEMYIAYDEGDEALYLYYKQITNDLENGKNGCNGN